MPFVISLVGYRPAPRFPPTLTPWTETQIDYSPNFTGPYTTFDTITLDPVDADPTEPQERSLTSTLAPAPTGYFKVTFLDADGNQEPTDPVRFPPGSDNPRPGPCSPWVAGSQVSALVPVQTAGQKAIAADKLTAPGLELICASAATAASEILYELSARLFTGTCGPVTVRPVARPVDADSRTWGARLSPLGWFSSWGLSTSYGSQIPGVMAHYGSSDPPTIRLPWPVSEIVQVKIDGTVIPPAEYELRDFQELVRIRPTQSSTPTARWGWPTSQIGDLPDTEPGTFSVTFTFGTPPPASGQLAALKLAEALTLPQLGDTTRYPQRVVQMARQGVSTQVASVIDVLSKGALGIWEVDAFILSVNPNKRQRQAAVWSPDMGRPRRQANPSLP